MSSFLPTTHRIDLEFEFFKEMQKRIEKASTRITKVYCYHAYNYYYGLFPFYSNASLARNLSIERKKKKAKRNQSSTINNVSQLHRRKKIEEQERKEEVVRLKEKKEG